eukprot:RCo028420
MEREEKERDEKRLREKREKQLQQHAPHRTLPQSPVAPPEGGVGPAPSNLSADELELDQRMLMQAIQLSLQEVDSSVSRAVRGSLGTTVAPSEAAPSAAPAP